VIGGIAGFLKGDVKVRGHSPLVRFIAVYTACTACVLSAIEYKTPWNMLPFMIGLVALAGVGAGWIADRFRSGLGKALAVVLLLVGTGHLGRQCYLGNFRYPADPRNPYVYAHTSPDYLRLVKRVHQIAEQAEAGTDMPIYVVANPHDVWPLPWYLRAYGEVGYWNEIQSVPMTNRPAVVVASVGLHDEMAQRLASGYLTEYYGLRPEVLMALSVRSDLWERFIASRSKE
jgi:predicted membrane-bound mannosyltransferase